MFYTDSAKITILFSHLTQKYNKYVMLLWGWVNNLNLTICLLLSNKFIVHLFIPYQTKPERNISACFSSRELYKGTDTEFN